MHTCLNCGYTTNRKHNLQLHYSRKSKCQPTPVVVESVVDEDNPCECKKCKKLFASKEYARSHEVKCDGLHVLQCKICLKMFKNTSAKSSHKYYGKCKPIETCPESMEQELERLRNETEILKALIANNGSTSANNGSTSANDGSTSANNNHTTNNTTNNNTNNTTNNTNNTNNTTINIHYNNYDKPYTDHITNNVMAGIYHRSNMDPALIMNETVRRIYKNDKHPENHVIKIREKSALSKVYKDGKEIMLPMDGVIQTVITNTGDFCAERIKDCHEEGFLIGTRVVFVWKAMELLGSNDRVDDYANRASYIQAVKAALL